MSDTQDNTTQPAKDEAIELWRDCLTTNYPATPQPQRDALLSFIARIDADRAEIERLNARVAELEATRPEPMLLPKEITPDGRELFAVWIDYIAQGGSEREARGRFVEGWAATVEENRAAGITPEQMFDARLCHREHVSSTAEETAAQKARRKAERWFAELLDDVTEYDEDPLHHVLNDRSVFDEMVNVLIVYRDAVLAAARSDEEGEG